MPAMTEKIIQKHLVEGVVERGRTTAIRINQTLTQGTTGAMACLQLGAVGVDQAKTDLSTNYVDHNTLQSGLENVDDHKYLQTAAIRYDVRFSRPGNGICHQVHLERFAKPQATLLGGDSHISIAGGMGALAIGTGDLDVTCVVAGMPSHLNVPNIVNVRLHGFLTRGVSSKGIILEVLQILDVKGGIGSVIEHSGDGVRGLSTPQRAAITNMGAELGAATSTFPSDEATWEFLKKQHREDVYEELKTDEDIVYDIVIDIDLNTLESVVAMPHSPDSVLPINEVLGLKVGQVTIGSCINSSYMGMMSVADILKNKIVDPNVSLVIFPDSRQVLHIISQNDGLSNMIPTGTRIFESTCGPCIGMGQLPIISALSLRTFNRDSYDRSGTLGAKICLVSLETAAASTLCGCIVDPRTMECGLPQEPEVFTTDDSMTIVPNAEATAETEIVYSLNIKSLPIDTPLEGRIDKKIMIKVGDSITIDHIVPAGAKVLPYRSGIEKINEFIFMNVKASFHDDCLEYEGGFIIAGTNYGQGSPREHTALAPMYLGIKAATAKSFARTHHADLINFGIIPFTFSDEEDCDTIGELDELTITNLKSPTEHTSVEVISTTRNRSFQVFHSLTRRDIGTILAGDTSNLIRRD